MKQLNILDKMPKRLIELMLHSSHLFKIDIDHENGIYLDLNTGMKSHAHLYYEDNKYIIRTRYDEPIEVIDLDEVLWCIKRCKCGRDYMNYSWATPLLEGFGEFKYEPLDYLN